MDDTSFFYYKSALVDTMLGARRLRWLKKVLIN